MKRVPALTFASVGVHQEERDAPFGWSRWKGLTQRMNIWRSWVVTWETHLPTAFLLVYWWRDDTEELGLTLYKASLSAASHSFKDYCCWNFSFRNSRTGSSRDTSTSPSTMSEVGPFYVLKERRVGINPFTHDPCANAQRETAFTRDLTAGAAVVDRFALTDEISRPTFSVAARIWSICVSDNVQLLCQSAPSSISRGAPWRVGCYPGAAERWIYDRKQYLSCFTTMLQSCFTFTIWTKLWFCTNFKEHNVAKVERSLWQKWAVSTVSGELAHLWSLLL